jgi:adenylate kinase
MQARGLTCPPIVMSELLTTPEMEKLKAQGGMVGDKEAVSALLRELLKPIYRDGVVLDGFPRTPVQVECLKLLVDKINSLHNEFANTPLAMHFRRPTIHAMVLFVSESTSITRQLSRGREIADHNKKVGRHRRRHGPSNCARRTCPRIWCAGGTGSSKNRPGAR